MLFDAMLLALIVALLGGGRISRLAELGLRRPWLFVAAFGLQLGILIFGAAAWQPGLAAAPALHLGSYLLLLVAIGVNRHLWAMWVAGSGVILNFIVIAANGGAMPAAADLVRASGRLRPLALLEAGRYPTHTLLDHGTRLPLLADNYLSPALPTHFPRSCVFSPGDVLITLGVVLLILRGMGAFGWGRRQRVEPSQAAAHGGPTARQ